MSAFPAAPLSQNANARAALLMLGSMAGFVVNDVCVKLASSEIATGQIMAVRGLMATVLLFALAASRGVLAERRRLLAPVVGIRTLADVFATITYITALGVLPIANVTAIFQALPLMITVGAAIFLKEAVGWRRWLATGLGFLGVLLVVRPGAEGFTLHSTLVLLSVLGCAVRDLSTRAIGSSVPTLLVASLTACANMLVGTALATRAGWQPMSVGTLSVLGIASIGIAIGYVLIVEAVRQGDAGFVAPFRYSVLVYALILGILIFGEIPDAATLIGSAVIVGSGLYTFYRERARGRGASARTAAKAAVP